MHFFKVPALLPFLVPSAIWRIRTSEKMIFLTFDDGPQPEVTSWVLEILKKYNANATFFCVGNNLSQYPQLALEILTQGHQIANHTYHHRKGWNSKNLDYFHEIEKTQLIINNLYAQTTKEKPKHPPFRPPYGRISPAQLQWAKQMKIPVVMWSLLSCDYDPKLNCTHALKVLEKNIQPGSIVVFHDSKKAYYQLKQLLPKFLEYVVAQGYSFGLLSNLTPTSK